MIAFKKILLLDDVSEPRKVIQEFESRANEMIPVPPRDMPTGISDDIMKPNQIGFSLTIAKSAFDALEYNGSTVFDGILFPKHMNKANEIPAKAFLYMINMTDSTPVFYIDFPTKNKYRLDIESLELYSGIINLKSYDESSYIEIISQLRVFYANNYRSIFSRKIIPAPWITETDKPATIPHHEQVRNISQKKASHGIEAKSPIFLPWDEGKDAKINRSKKSFQPPIMAKFIDTEIVGKRKDLRVINTRTSMKFLSDESEIIDECDIPADETDELFRYNEIRRKRVARCSSTSTTNIERVILSDWNQSQSESPLCFDVIFDYMESLGDDHEIDGRAGDRGPDYQSKPFLCKELFQIRSADTAQNKDNDINFQKSILSAMGATNFACV
jgi:CheY-like chemotaxis protein